MSDISKNQELDWDNMANPVPMNLIDSDFPEAELLPKTTPEITRPTLSTVALEEAAQRERLDQWMANARARLQMADEETAVPGRPFKPRWDASPSLIRRIESQKTIFDSGEETVPGYEMDSGYRTGKISLDGKFDPMATLIVPRETFTNTPENENLDPKTEKLKAIERQVAKIKLNESGAETLIMATPQAPNMANVRLALWIIAGITPVTIGLGLFALMKIGYLDSVEDIFTSITGQVSHPLPTTIVTPVEATSVTAIVVASNVVATKNVAPKPLLPKTTTRNTNATETPITNAQEDLSTSPPDAQPVKTVDPAIVAMSDASSLAAKSLARARLNAEVSMAGIQVAKPSFHSETASAANGEAALKTNVQAALNADAENMQAMYERFSISTPGLTGDIIIGITVLPSGHIVEGNVSSSSIGDPTFDQDLLRKVLVWKLPAFPDNRPRYVAIPFHFQPRDP